jgi:hypothetical protein
MDTEHIREYQIRQRAKNVAETPWLVLPGDNKLARRLIKLSFIKDARNPDKLIGAHAEILYQKRQNQKSPWPSKTVDLTTIPKDFGFKFSLDSAQTSELAQALQDAYSIGSGEIKSGKRTVLRGISEDEIIVTPKNKAKVLLQLKDLLDQNDINEWIGANLQTLPSDLALARLCFDRKASIEDFKNALQRTEDEHYWQRFLRENSWMFGSGCIEILSERRLDIHHETDFPIRVEGGFMDIVEIKQPQLPFWAALKSGEHYKYRGKFLIPHAQLQGAIAQTMKYILQAEKKVDSDEYMRDHGGIMPLKPRGLVIQGRSNEWNRDEWEAFRLLNDELHSIQVMTFDHLLRQAERMLAVMEVSHENPNPEIVDPDEISDDDIPF